jgi:putative tryptophan/tyrosine transport system substrate-binding protein
VGPTSAAVQTKAVAVAAQQIHASSEVLEMKQASDFDAVFEIASARHPNGLLILSSPLVSINSKRLAELALKYRLPAISLFSSFARSGGLISYGPNLDDLYRSTGAMAGKTLKGASGALPPAERPTRFELIVNLQTAKALNLALPTSIQLRADEVIE